MLTPLTIIAALADYAEKSALYSALLNKKIPYRGGIKMKAILRRTTTMLCAAVMAVPMALSVYASIPEPTSGVKFDNSVVISNESGSSISGGVTDQPVTSSDYTITIPATFDIKNSGWNEIGDISASGTLKDGKKLVVSAASENGWALKSGENSVGYTMKNAETDTAAADTWEFTDLPASQKIGVDVDEYRGKPAGSYTDTVTFTASVEDVAPANPYAAANVNDVVSFGGYDWYVINKRDDGVTLLMKENLTTKAYNDSETDVTWETCTLRTYLNGEFYNGSGFSDEDRKKIVNTNNTNPNNPGYGTGDYIFLLSIDEANALTKTIRADSKGNWWWLRSPGSNSKKAASVYGYGGVNTDGSDVDYLGGVRPALNLKF